MEVLQVRIPDFILEKIDAILIKNKKWKTKSEFSRQAITEFVIDQINKVE